MKMVFLIILENLFFVLNKKVKNYKNLKNSSLNRSLYLSNRIKIPKTPEIKHSYHNLIQAEWKELWKKLQGFVTKFVIIENCKKYFIQPCLY